MLFRAAIAVAAVVFGNAVDDSLIGGVLQLAVDGGVGAIAFRIGIGAKSANHVAADHFRHVGGLGLQLAAVVAGRDFTQARGFVGFLVDIT